MFDTKCNQWKSTRRKINEIICPLCWFEHLFSSILVILLAWPVIEQLIFDSVPTPVFSANLSLYTVTSGYNEPLSCWNRKWLAFATSIEPGQLAHPCSLTRLYTVGWPASNFHLNISKNDNGQFQKLKVG